MRAIPSPSLPRSPLVFFFSRQFFARAQLSERLEQASTEPIRYLTLHFREHRGSFSPLQNRAKINFLMCKQKPRLVWFLAQAIQYCVSTALGTDIISRDHLETRRWNARVLQVSTQSPDCLFTANPLGLFSFICVKTTLYKMFQQFHNRWVVPDLPVVDRDEYNNNLYKI